MAKDKRFHIQDTPHNKEVLRQGDILLGIAHKALTNVKFLGSTDMYCITDAIALVDRALANRIQARRDWLGI